MSKIFSQYIIISGPDAHKFLQSQITADLELLNEENILLSSYCNRQGRVLSVFYVIRTFINNQEQYIIIFVGDTAEIFLNTIKKYSIFSKVEYSQILEAENIQYTDDSELNNKLIKILSLEHCIENLVPVICSENSGKYLPNELNLIPHSAVSFKKGCFLGQEIIARVFYKGKTKKALTAINKSELNDEHKENILANNHDIALVVTSI